MPLACRPLPPDHVADSFWLALPSVHSIGWMLCGLALHPMGGVTQHDSSVYHRPSSLWAEETLFLSVFTFFWGLFSSPTLFAATGQHQLCSWFPFSAEQLTFSFWAYGFICGWPRPVSSRSAKLPGWRSPPIVTIVTIVRLLPGAK